jgi:hypothetical protein
MVQVSEFRNREIVFLGKGNYEKYPFSGYQITTSDNYEELQKILNIQDKNYNSYVTIATYENIPRFPLDPKQHWPQYRAWNQIRDKSVNRLDFFMDFDGSPTIEGIKEAYQDAQTAQKLLYGIIGEQAQWLSFWFSGGKGVHLLGKCKSSLTPNEILNKQKEIAFQLQPICPTIDTGIYDIRRLRKLLGSHVNSVNFGTTRVIPIANNKVFKELLTALETKNEEWFNKQELKQLGSITL